LILTPFCVPYSLAPFTKTSETKALEFPEPKLPMLHFITAKLSNMESRENITNIVWREKRTKMEVRPDAMAWSTGYVRGFHLLRPTYN